MAEGCQPHLGEGNSWRSLSLEGSPCNNSSELLALARPGNKTMAMALVQTYQNAGISISRTGTSLIMGANLLAPLWTWGSREFSSYHSFFIFYGVLAAVLLLLLPTLPAIVPKHRDYYQP